MGRISRAQAHDHILFHMSIDKGAKMGTVNLNGVLMKMPASVKPENKQLSDPLLSIELKPVHYFECDNWINCQQLAAFKFKKPCPTVAWQPAFCDSGYPPCEHRGKLVSTSAGIIYCTWEDETFYLPYFKNPSDDVRKTLYIISDVRSDSLALVSLTKQQTNEILGPNVTNVGFKCSAPKFIALEGFEWTAIYNTNLTEESCNTTSFETLESYNENFNCPISNDGSPTRPTLPEQIPREKIKFETILLVGANTERIRKQDVILIFEFCENGNVLEFIRARRETFVDQFNLCESSNVYNVDSAMVEYENCVWRKFCSEDLIRWGIEIATGMDFIASKNVYHGDLAARNILLTHHLVAKVGDFGLAKDLKDYALYVQGMNCPLPLKWMSLESLRDLEFSIQSDVWSFGITMWEIFSLGSKPYPGVEWNFQAWKRLQDGERMDRPSHATQSIHDILLKCWETLPQDRPTFSELKQMFKCELDELPTC
ncbi:unnamed protein product [Allacma fusca]|uniref:Protein kinase domain-containing protein n=1 Tax=Allacma fusca TaxID=39272 RepID=A0A8J2NVW0_9HEXA|nr:unnamed protein product [Allacma fusca]